MHISAVVTDPTDDVKSMVPERRKCLLEPETKNSLYEVLWHGNVNVVLTLFLLRRQSSFLSTQNQAVNWRIASKIFWPSTGKKEVFSNTFLNFKS